MSDSETPPLLAAWLEAWDRHAEVLLNLLAAVPPGGLAARAGAGSPTVAEMFGHMHHERMVSVLENAPEHAGEVPSREWDPDEDRERVAQRLSESGRRVREAVAERVRAARDLDLEFAHPTHLIAFLIFHEGYHHGQIKLALKAAGCPVPDEVVGPLTWRVWRRREPAERDAAERPGSDGCTP